MKKLLIIASLLVTLIIASGCTDNSRAKNFGGTAQVSVPVDTKVVTCSWKEDQLWILTRPMLEDEEPVTYNYIEDSKFKILEGKFIITESKSSKE